MPERTEKSPATTTRSRISRLAALRASAAPPSAVDLFDDEDPLLPSPPPPFSGIRLPDRRTLAWAEYGNPRGVPCVLIPDSGSSRLAPTWLLHDAAVPAAVRLLAVDRPGVGASDPVGIGGREDLADDLAHMVQTLAVGRIAVIGVGHGVDDALALADRHPTMVSAAIGVSARTGAVIPEQPGAKHRLLHRPHPWDGPLLDWAGAAGRADLSRELTWRRALDRMSADAVESLGERWRERDFRQAVATDLALGQPDRDHLHAPDRAPRWTQRWSSRVPVHLWHGRQEWATHVSAIRAVADHRPGWDVMAVPGCSALLGYWPEILQQAHLSFLTPATNPEPEAESHPRVVLA
jgi:pimeloyl-ACP methyl ester carboxylesterase